jgi:hypothetical protein
MNLTATAVVIDLAANVIRLVVPEAAGLLEDRCEGTVTGLLDVGANGRLLGVELDGAYVSVMDPLPGTGALVRSATVRVGISGRETLEISIPRHGQNYEITYPSGNQCWQVTTIDGALIQLCATSAGEPVAPGGEDAAPTGTTA